MIDSFISAIATVLYWIVGIIADIAYFFSRVAYYSGQIPGVGSYLKSFFTSIQAAFNDFGYDFVSFSTRLQNVLNAIDNWLDDLVDLINDVHGWIMDRIDYAYTRARNAWDWVVNTGRYLYNDVYGWISDKLDRAYRWADNALDWIAYTGMDIYRAVYGWISDKLDDAYSWAKNALDWIADFPSHIAALLGPLTEAILQDIAPVFNLVSLYFDAIRTFFSDPLGTTLSWLTGITKAFEQTLLDIADKIGDALFGD